MVNRASVLFWSVDYNVENLKIEFDNEKSREEFGRNTFEVVYRITGATSSPVDLSKATTAFLNALENQPLSGVQIVPLGEKWHKTNTKLFPEEKSDAVIQNTILLSYQSDAELDRNIEYLRQLYAHILSIFRLI